MWPKKMTGEGSAEEQPFSFGRVTGFNECHDLFTEAIKGITEDELTELAAKYHFELGLRMVADNGKNEKISPSREFAKVIKQFLIKKVGNG